MDIFNMLFTTLTNGSGSGITPLDHTVTFLSDGEPYEVVSVKNGNWVNAPVTDPTSENVTFVMWQSNGGKVDFPCLVESNVEFNALFVKSLADKIYTYYGIDKNIYPYVFLGYCSAYGARIVFSQSVKTNQINIYADDNYTYSDAISIDDADFPTDYNDSEAIVNFFLEKVSSVSNTSRGVCGLFNSSFYTVWTNADVYQGKEEKAVYHFI